MKEYIDFKGKGTRIQYPHSRTLDERDRVIPDDAIIMAIGFWWVLLPNDKHPEAMLLPNDPMFPPRWVHRSKCIDVEDAKRILRDANEFYRVRGGRPPKKREPVVKPGPRKLKKDYTLGEENG